MAGPQQLALVERTRILARRKWVVAACLVAGASGAYVWSARKAKLYYGTATLLARTVPSQTDVFSNQNLAPASDVQDRDVATQIKILESPAVQAAIQKQIPNAPRVRGSQVGSTNEFTARASSRDPNLAAATANAAAQAYIQFQRDQSVADDTAAAQSVNSQVQAIQGQIDAVQAQIDRLTASDASSERSVATDPNISLAQQQHQQLLQQQTVFQNKLAELNVDAQLKQSPAVLVAAAVPERSPYAPRPLRTAALAAFAALLLGGALAFLLDYVDDRIKSRDDVEAAAGGIAVLGNLPKVASPRGGQASINIAELGPTSAVAEAFRSLRTNVQFLSVEQHSRTLLVTSPATAEGKTTVAANLAIALGRAGVRVIVVDADMRKPRLDKFFGLGATSGLSSVLSGSASLADAFESVPGEPNLRVLPAGPVPPDPSELLGSERSRRLFAALAGQCDQLIIDTPPVLPVTDAVALSPRVDACVVVATAGSSKKRQLARAINSLRQVNAPVVGVVVNGITDRFQDGYGYGYGYGYRNGYAYGYGDHAAAGGTSSRRSRPRKAARVEHSTPV
jgi:capsular exopolysaccharide synthesis family protein